MILLKEIFGPFLISFLIGYSAIHSIRFKNSVARVFASFGLGFVILALTGVIANNFQLPIYESQLSIGLLFSIKTIHTIYVDRKVPVHHDKEIVFLLIILSIYLFLIWLFNPLIMWSSSDAIYHTSIVRMLMDKGTVQFNPLLTDYGDLDSYFQSYPKLFHFYLFFMVKFFNLSLIGAIKNLPLLFTVIIPMGVYSFLREIDISSNTARYSFFLIFLQLDHYFPLFFSLIPSMLSLFMVCLSLLFAVKIGGGNKLKVYFIIILLVFSQFLVHQRYVFHLLLVLGWVAAKMMNPDISLKKYVLLSFPILSIGFLFLGRFNTISLPIILLGYLLNFYTIAIKEWYIGFVALPALILLFRKKGVHEIIFGWLALWFLLALFSDLNILNLSLSPERTYQELYLPLSIVAGITFGDILLKNKGINIHVITMILLIAIIPFYASSIYSNYGGNWRMGKENYDVIQEMNQRKGLVLNTDPLGSWIYPLTGNPVTNPYGKKGLLTDLELSQVYNEPGSTGTLSLLKDLEKKNGDIYVFISSKSTKGGGMNLFGRKYPKVDIERFLQTNSYEIIKEEKGAYLIKYG